MLVNQPKNIFLNNSSLLSFIISPNTDPVNVTSVAKNSNPIQTVTPKLITGVWSINGPPFPECPAQIHCPDRISNGKYSRWSRCPSARYQCVRQYRNNDDPTPHGWIGRADVNARPSILFQVIARIIHRLPPHEMIMWMMLPLRGTVYESAANHQTVIMKVERAQNVCHDLIRYRKLIEHLEFFFHSFFYLSIYFIGIHICRKANAGYRQFADNKYV